MNMASNLPFVSFVARPDACVSLICVPWAGAGASLFHGWSARQPAEIEIFAIRLAGRETRLREVPLDRAESVVAEMRAGIRGLPDRPVVIFGACFGAVLGFELARALREDGRAV